ncbi:MAG TPA: TRAP transporter fused permease subunit [Burkholderiales bacterium]
MQAKLERAAFVSNVLILAVGALMIVYVGSAVLGLVSSSARHYSAFVLFVMIMSGLASIKVLVLERPGRGEIEDASARAVPAKAPWSLRVRAALAAAGSLLAIAGAAYVLVHADRLERTAPFFTSLDMWMGGALVAGVVLLTLVHWGLMLSSLIALAIAYFFLGQHITHPIFAHPGYDPEFVMNYVGLGVTQGVFLYAQTAADDIFFLVLYATTLFGLGVMPMIVETGRLAGRRLPGGAAAPAVFGSAAVGAVMGTAVSNVVLCGRFTIPLMTRYGYSPAMAGAIEATASTCAQIMPPVLGLAAFLIAATLGIAYIDVVKAAVLPGVLYITGMAIGVGVYAMRHQLPRLTDPVDMRVIWRLLPTFGVSFLTVIALLVNYYSPSIAGIAGIAVALVLSAFQGPYRPKLRELTAAVQDGLVLVSLLSLLLIAIGPLGQAFQTTNLSGKLGIWLITVLPDSMIVLLMGAALLSIILGVGLPTPVAYLVAALAVVPFMIQIGVAPLQAHYFVFYFAVYSALTPPVAVAVLAAAKISGASFWDTGIHSMKLAATTFIIPFAFVFNRDLMAFPNSSWWMLRGVVEILVVQAISSIFLYGYFRRRLTVPERFASFVVVMLGYTALMNREPIYTYVAAASAVALLAWVWATPRAAVTAAP